MRNLPPLNPQNVDINKFNLERGNTFMESGVKKDDIILNKGIQGYPSLS